MNLVILFYIFTMLTNISNRYIIINISERYKELGKMSTQLTLNFGIEQPKKRVRYVVPKYLKFYSLYQYDRIAFKTLMQEWIETEEGKNRTYATLKAKQDEILNQCYILDEDGNRLRDSDSKHIFRIRTLYSIYQEIYRCIVFFNPCFINVQGMLIDTEEKHAEIDGTCYLPIRQRVIIHIRLLRLLRKGYSIKEGLCQLHLTKEIIENTMTEIKNL